MSVGQYIPFGLRPNGELVDPLQVERGLACNCVCPGCRQPLAAKKGDIRVHHFSHVADRNCANGQVTALHLAAKQVLARERRMVVPQLVVTVQRAVRPQVHRSKTKEASQRTWQFTSVALEAPYAGHRADVLGTFDDGANAVVEFRVTAGADAAKRAAYREAGTAAIEVDLSALLGELLTLQELTMHVCDVSSNKSWLHHPQAAGLEKEALAELLKEWPPLPPPTARLATRLPFDDTRGLDPQRLPVRREHERHRALSLDEKWKELYAGLGTGPEQWPPVLDAAVETNPPGIQAPRRMWQGAVFQQFVLNAASKGWEGQSFSNAAFNGWCDARFGAGSGLMSLLHKEVAAFLQHLERSGYLRSNGDRYVVVRDTL